MSAPEAWLRGPLPDVHPFIQPLLHTFTEAREELCRQTEGLTTEQLWERPHGAASVGFHIRHIGGSAQRLMTYLQGRQLTAEQMSAMKSEQSAGASRDELLAELDAALASVESIARSLDPAAFAEPRGVGRKQLPTTVIGLLIHISEHTLRHVGQAVTTAKFVRGS